MKHITSKNPKRYQSLIISISTLLALIALLLVFTFVTSRVLESNAILMNETNRVANSAEQVIKDLFDLQNNYGDNINAPHMQTAIHRLEYNKNYIDSSLMILAQGGEMAVDGETVVIPSPKTDTAQEALAEATTQWQALAPHIDKYLLGATDIMVDSSDALYQAAMQARTSSLMIDNTLQLLISETVKSNHSQAVLIRLIQMLGVVFIFMYFIVFVFYIMRRLRETDNELFLAQQETEEIMQTVNTGLFLLDKQLNIGNQYSKALESIIGQTELAGQSFSAILKNRISDKDLKTAESFVDQLYNPKVKEKLVHNLNPLHKVMFYGGHGGTENRYLDFEFSRVYEDKEIARILVNVNDVSEAVRLEQRLAKERNQNDRQIEMLTTILNVSPAIIDEFIANTYVRIDKMNNILKNPGSSQFELERKLKSIYREMHSLKGEASALKLHSFIKIASEAEDKLHALQNQGKLLGSDFLPLTVQLDELLNLSQTIKEINARINSTTQSITSKPKQKSALVQIVENEDDEVHVLEEAEKESDLAKHLKGFAKEIADRQNKKVELSVDGADVILPKPLESVVKEILIQLLRNAVVHGIEDSDERTKHGKSAFGNLKASITSKDDQALILVEDDGRGVDYNAISQKLLDSGRYSQAQVEGLSKAQLLSMLFMSGFSTKEEADEDGGRGVGLDIVKERIKEYGGKINIQSGKGQFTRFIVKLPLE